MKNIFVFLLIIMIPICGMAQKSVRKFYQQIPKTEGNVKMTLPGFLVHMGAGIAKKHVEDDEDAKLALEMTKYIKKIKIVVAEDQSSISQKNYNRFVDIARTKDKFDDLIMVKDGKTNVNIMMRGNSKKIKNLLVLVKDGEEFVMMSMKTSLRYSDLNKFLSVILKKESKVKLMPQETKKTVKKAIKKDRA